MEDFLERFGYKLEPRANISNLKVLFITLLAILFAFFVTGILIASFGVNPFNAYSIIIKKTLFDFRGFSEVLRKSIPLMLAGVGLVLAFRAQFWNIGAEGQILAGAFAASGLALFVHLPAVIMIPAMFLAGFIAGGLWGFVPALLKVKLGVNEIITTLMMNYIALYTIRWLINGPWKGHKANSTGYSYSDKFLREYWLPTLGRTRLHWPTLLIAVLFAIFVAFLLARMKFGFEIRIMGESQNAAKYAGINFFSTTIGLMLLAAGAAGIAGVGEVAGIHHRLIEPNSISLGYGYTAIIVALLARGNPIAAIFSALFLGWVFASGDIMRVSLHLPSQIVGVINGLILLSIIAVEPLIKNRFIKIKKGN